MYSRTSKSIGSGSFSDVYRAVNLDGSGDYAWKQLKSDRSESDAERFRREVEILSSLDHDNIIDVIYTDLLAPLPYFVMPRAVKNLERAIKFDVDRKIDIPKVFREICEGVIHAHGKGVLHRDLKPQNILLMVDGSVRISDFGLARSFHYHQPGLTKVNETGGTHPYAAPEQFDGALKDVDLRADVFSLGKILYYLYTKRDPYLIEASQPLLPAEVYAIIKKATDADREMRFVNVESLLQAFLKFVGGEPSPGTVELYSPKFVSVQLKAQAIARSGKAKKRISNKQIEEIVIELQQLMWRNRNLLWAGNVENPLKILDPTIALNLLGFRTEYFPTLGNFFESGKEYEVAGQINQSARTVSISRQFDDQIIKFTGAHELGHSFLHTQEVIHRDRPINGSSSKVIRLEEFQANKFATYFLMPEKQVRKKFHAIFGAGKFQINQRMAEALLQTDVDTFVSRVRNSRGLARFIAGVTQIGSRPVSSLAELFGVSNEAMAIRLEEIGIVE